MSVTAWTRKGGPDPMAAIASDDEAVPAPASYEETYRSCYARLTRVAYLIIGSNEAAEEVVQDAFVALYPRFQRVRSPEAYLYRSVVNGSRAWLRRRRIARRVGHAPVATEVAAPELDETREALDKLPPGRRAVVVLRFYADLSLAEIAEALGCGTGTVKSQLHRGLAQLRMVVER